MLSVIPITAKTALVIEEYELMVSGSDLSTEQLGSGAFEVCTFLGFEGGPLTDCWLFGDHLRFKYYR